jgi:WD40 repeat protein
LDWHPNSQLLVTGSTDLKCRVFSAFVSDVDGEPDSGPFPALAPFGEPMAEFDNASAWVNGVAWSPKGNRLAFAGECCVRMELLLFVSTLMPSPVCCAQVTVHQSISCTLARQESSRPSR